MDQRVLLELRRFRLIAHSNGNGTRLQLQVRSGRLGGDDQWFVATRIGEYDGFVQELARTLECGAMSYGPAGV